MKAILLLWCALFFVTALFLVAPARAQKAWTAAQLIEFVDSQIKLKGDDRATADYLRGIKLTQKLESRDVENGGAAQELQRDRFNRQLLQQDLRFTVNPEIGIGQHR